MHRAIKLKIWNFFRRIVVAVTTSVGYCVCLIVLQAREFVINEEYASGLPARLNS